MAPFNVIISSMNFSLQCGYILSYWGVGTSTFDLVGGGRPLQPKTTLLSKSEFKALLSDTQLERDAERRWAEVQKLGHEQPWQSVLSHEGEEKRGRGKRRQGKKDPTPQSSVRGPSKHFSAPCSEFLLRPQSSFCIHHRDLFLNETWLAEPVETASCLFHTPLETYNKLLLTEITRVHSYSCNLYVLTAVNELMLHALQ